jgi:hypothetical protein
VIGEWTRAVAEQRCELVTIVAEAGVGKTRLAAEALTHIESLLALASLQALPHEDRATPLAFLRWLVKRS